VSCAARRVYRVEYELRFMPGRAYYFLMKDTASACLAEAKRDYAIKRVLRLTPVEMEPLWRGDGETPGVPVAAESCLDFGNKHRRGL
jgi:hypothetical protein